MSSDNEGAEEQPSAQDYAVQLRAQAVRILTEAGHSKCDMLNRARYVPESGAVVCGCGEFAPWSDNRDNPPWEPISEEPNGRPNQVAIAGHDIPQAADPIQATLALIDPTQIYTPEDVERHILEVLYRLETGALFERETVEAASATETAFTRKFNAAVDSSEQSSADRRKAEAMVKADAEYEAWMRAKMVKEAVKQTMHNLRAVLSGYQSTARSVGSAYQAGGSQGAPQQREGRPW